jgi:hypothetical protein
LLETNIEILNKLKIKKDSFFYAFFSNYLGVEYNENNYIPEIFTLSEIYNNLDTTNKFWNNITPEISTRFLQLNTTEGEASYFYCIDDDMIYDTSWSEMEDMINNRTKPYMSFFDFVVMNATLKEDF